MIFIGRIKISYKYVGILYDFLLVKKHKLFKYNFLSNELYS